MIYIKAQDIKKHYGSREIVKGINVEVCENEILALIGPNGSGKTTTLEMLIGLRNTDNGTIHYWTKNYKGKIGVQLQTVPLFPGLTTIENLKLFSAFYKKKMTNEQVEQLLVKCGLYETRSTEATRLSGGQQKRLAIAAALVHEPKLVFLDEPTAALDPRSRQEIHRLIKQLFDEGKSIVFTSHDMDEVLKLATRVIMIEDGEIITEGEPIHLCQKYNVKNLEYLYLKLTAKEEVH